MLREGTDLSKIAAKLPPNFTGADFSALTTEAYMIAVKLRIAVVQNQIEQYKQENGMEPTDELLPETYFKLVHPDDLEAVEQELRVEVGEEHLEEALGQVVPSISL